MNHYHKPVLLQEVMENLQVKPGWDVVDGTLGGGGHSFAILEASSPNGRLIGIDRDEEALEAAKANLEKFTDRLTLAHDNYRNIKKILYMNGWSAIDAAIIDLGVSSYQLDKGVRGFSYMQDGPLDMRMNCQDQLTAKMIVNTYDKSNLIRILKMYGEERWADRIAEFIVNTRLDKEISTTLELVNIIDKAIPKKVRDAGSHPAKKTFQALRIAVNQELEGLQKAIVDFSEVMRPGGRLAVISFHSLEDRIVKNTFKYLASNCECPPKVPVCICSKRAMVKIITKKALIASYDEQEENPRSKSAKLRVMEKL